MVSKDPKKQSASVTYIGDSWSVVNCEWDKDKGRGLGYHRERKFRAGLSFTVFACKDVLCDQLTTVLIGSYFHPFHDSGRTSFG